ncbi:hypothetical protein ASZ90_018800 [hydrocarbon metagenome]|uniref:Accessory gene regulator b n=1 Tax=hydrocarbon metagenome TaxID=938273 RepID=A0A0W8E587_9ZZZZ
MDRNLYQRLALFLGQENDLAQEKAAELAYAIEILLINGLNLILTMLIGFLLGVLPGTIVCILVATAYRHTAGGAHSRNPWTCAIATMIIFPALAYLGTYVAAGPDVIRWAIVATAGLIGIYAVYCYAPVDSAEAPIISPVRRNRLRRYSAFVIGILVTMLLLLEVISPIWLYGHIIQVCAALTVIWVSFNLTNNAATIWCMLDNQH